MPDFESALTALQQHFGFDSFRPGQREVIDAILEGRDTVVVMPTGGGKSLCYQLPALMKPGATIVVSPLIALMKDQVDALVARDLPATFINSSIPFEEQKIRITGVRRGLYKLVYVAPERFRSSHFLDALRSIDISLFAIDEAHCISQWGHDFRPDYLRLRQTIDDLGRPQIAALTATATPYVRADIIQQLSLREPRAFVSGFDRPNLSISVVHTQKEHEKITRIRALAVHHAGSGIIYASTRKAVEQVTRKLQSAGLKVIGYHAGMDEASRTAAQDDFMAGRTQMIVATNAFGMGIDKPDIRFVVHYQLPGSIEAYYQEIGRAGRDQLPSACVLLFNYADKRTQDYFIEGSYPLPETIARVYQTLVATNLKRIDLSASELAARSGIRNEMAVQSSLTILEKAGHIERGSSSENRAALHLKMKPHEARASARIGETSARQVLYSLLGGYDLTERRDINLDVTGFAETLGMEPVTVRRSLLQLSAAGVIGYKPQRRTRGVLLLNESPVTNLRIRPQEVARRAALEQRKLREMISFCYVETCYRAFILDYFGDTLHAATCGTCGNCVANRGGVRRRKPDPAVPFDEPTSLDDFVRSHVPAGLDLELELAAAARVGSADKDAVFAGSAQTPQVSVTQPRILSDEESLLVRKILSCAARMEGRFGKGMLASTLRGSRARNLLQAHLDKLSTYGILSDMTQEELMVYIDALVAAGCLHVTGGAYPMVILTPLGGDVMRARTRVELQLGERVAPIRGAQTASATGKTPKMKSSGTVDETYALYKEGVSIEEIGERRGLTVMTIEKHLAECIMQGRDIDISPHIETADRELIEKAIEQFGTQLLKPLREALPPHITYRMIRFVVAETERETAKLTAHSTTLLRLCRRTVRPSREPD